MSTSTPSTPQAMSTTNDQPAPDVVLIVEDCHIHAHKSYLSSFSPIFKAMFEHNTKEAQTGQVQITNYTSKTVKKAIVWIYGTALIDYTHQEVFDIYKFVDKYDIEDARKLLLKHFVKPVTEDNFNICATFGLTYSNETVMMNCGYYTLLNLWKICTSINHNHDPSLVMAVLCWGTEEHKTELYSAVAVYYSK